MNHAIEIADARYEVERGQRLSKAMDTAFALFLEYQRARQSDPRPVWVRQREAGK